ncbi:MAG: hypothetical protein ACODAC_05165 [Pseudomonadota bacterium]
MRERSDEELTALAAQWDSLNQHQRRALLTEMKLRMAGNGESKGVRIRTERRYGRIIRQSDGRVIRIETQVVHVRPIDEDSLSESRHAFGVGFEHRLARRQRSAPKEEHATNGDAGTDAILDNVLKALEPARPVPQEKARPPVLRVADPGS